MSRYKLFCFELTTIFFAQIKETIWLVWFPLSLVRCQNIFLNRHCLTNVSFSLRMLVCLHTLLKPSNKLDFKQQHGEIFQIIWRPLRYSAVQAVGQCSKLNYHSLLVNHLVCLCTNIEIDEINHLASMISLRSRLKDLFPFSMESLLLPGLKLNHLFYDSTCITFVGGEYSDF